MNNLIKSLIIFILFSLFLSNIALAKIEEINQREAKILLDKETLPFNIHDAVKLQDGTFLIVKSIDLPSRAFATRIYSLLKENLKEKYFKQNNKNPNSEDNNIQFSKYYYDYLNKYIALSEEEKAKIYLPLIKDDNEKYEHYLKYIDRRKKVENAQIYNPKTKERKTVGKRTIQELIYDKTLLNDGRVLLTYYDHGYKDYPTIPKIKKLEIYSPKTEQFKRLKDLKNTNIIHILKNGKILVNITDEKDYKIIKKTAVYDINTETYTDLDIKINEQLYKTTELNDGRILILNSNDKEETSSFIYFDSKNNSFTKSKKLYCNCLNEFFKTSDDIIYIIANRDIYKLNTKNDSFEKIGKISIPRRKCSMKVINNSIFIYNGEICYFDDACTYEDRIEIFNIKTKKRIIKRKLFSSYNWYVTPTDDKKVLIYVHEANRSFIYTED